MKHTIVRAQPVLPPVEKIVLEVTPEELFTLIVAIGRSNESMNEAHRKSVPTYFNATAPMAPNYDVYNTLTDAGREIGVVLK